MTVWRGVECVPTGWSGVEWCGVVYCNPPWFASHSWRAICRPIELVITCSICPKWNQLSALWWKCPANEDALGGTVWCRGRW